MSKEITETIPQDSEEKIDPNQENISATGQIILGEIEKIGGILTANPTAQAEGEYNIEVGKLRRETAEDLAETESDDE